MLTVIDKISEQLEAVISSLVTIEKRVCNNEENISKLNMVIYRKLEQSKHVKNNLFSLQPLREVELAETTKFEVKRRVVEEEEFEG